MTENKKRYNTPLDDIIKEFRRRYRKNDDAQRIAELYRLGLLTFGEAVKKIIDNDNFIN